MESHLVFDRTIRMSKRDGGAPKDGTDKLIDPRWIGMNGAFATRSPSGANRAQEKSRRSLMLVLIEVCCKDRPIASATLMKRLANSVSKMGSGPFVLDFAAIFAERPERKERKEVKIVVGGSTFCMINTLPFGFRGFKFGR